MLLLALGLIGSLWPRIGSYVKSAGASPGTSAYTESVRSSGIDNLVSKDVVCGLPGLPAR